MFRTTQLLCQLFFLVSSSTLAQDLDAIKPEQPYFQLFRANENYAYLQQKELYQKDFFDPIKYIPFKKGTAHLSIGGQIRTRFEHFSNRFWVEDANENFYSQRIALYSSLVLNKHLRIYGELYHGSTSGEDEIVQDDEMAIFQMFVDYILYMKDGKTLQSRLGRQELGLGASRLVGIREGPNIRRSFDMCKIHYSSKYIDSKVFYGIEVVPRFGVFDNPFNLFGSNTSNSILWGIYNQFSIPGLSGKQELYYLGFKNNQVTFNDVSGIETRHTIGIRRFGGIGENQRFQFNTEILYQFGKLDDQDIAAWAFAINAHYLLIENKWKPRLGLKLECTSGDRKSEDGKIQSYNPMFVNPAFYSLAATIAPTNIFSVHPSLSARSQKINIYLEWAIFWRNSEKDALYRPTRFVLIPFEDNQSKSIGHQFGFKASYELNRHFTFDLDISYFLANAFLGQNDRDNNILHIAPTAGFKF